uniref:glycosyltransferase n=3 Tax=Pseudomonadota TaxID=1224 RepID=UPI0013D0C648
IHDLVPLRLPYLTEDNKRYHYKLLRHLTKSADHIVTVSETSKQDIIRILGVDEKRITNTYQAVHVPLDLREKPEGVAADE